MKTYTYNLSILKRFIFLIIILFYGSFLYSQDFPKQPNPPKLVNDFVGIFNQQEKAALEQKLDNYVRSTTTRICIVVVDDLQGLDKADYAVRLAQQWGIGQKGTNNGILVLIKPTGGKGKRDIYIAVGYGLESVITDASTRKIIEEEMLPFFRNNSFYAGVDKGTSVLMSLASKEYSEQAYVKKKQQNKSPFVYLIPFIVIGIVLLRAKKSNNRPMTVGSGTNSSIPFWMSLFFFSSMFGGGGRGGWDDFSSGGGDSGGDGDFGGFGGGDFGGGGAGGSW